MSDLTDFGMLLGFSPEWYALGIIDHAFLERARTEWDTADDKNTEHWRYRAFTQFLDARRPLSSELAAALYQLGANDSDEVMGGAMQHKIISLPECPPELRKRAIASGDRSLAKLATRLELVRELDGGVTVELFERCMTGGDSVVQRRLVQEAKLTRTQVERLAQTGANRAIQNLARDRLGAREYLAEMDQFRKEIRKHHSLLHVYECPISLIRAAVELSEGDATVENLHPDLGSAWFPLEIQLFPGSDVAKRMVRWASLDVALKRENFLELLPFWEQHGVYAVFSTLGPIKFRSTALAGDARYLALKNFNWSLELAIPGSGGGEWGHIASPDPKKIDLLFAKAGASYA